MKTILKVQHIYGQDICFIDDMTKLSDEVTIVCDPNIQNELYAIGTYIRVGEEELKVNDISMRVENSTLVTTLHVQDSDIEHPDYVG